MSFISKELSVPLFLQERNTYRINRPELISKYVSGLSGYYKKACKTDAALSSKVRKSINAELNSIQKPCASVKKPTLEGPHKIKSTKFHVSPNLYNIQNEKISQLGAYWAKIPQKSENLRNLQGQKNYKSQQKEEFMTVNDDIEKRFAKYKGLFLTNARERRPTERCMVSDLLACERNPNDPTCATYYPRGHEISQNLDREKIREHVAYRFGYKSTVPYTRPPLIKSNTAYTPSPAQYKTSNRKIYHIPPARMYHRNDFDEIEKQKRLKFRRLPYKKLKTKNNFDPEFAHVKGNGFQRLFKNIPPKEKYNLEKWNKILREKEFNLYPDAKYRNMINKPRRNSISIRATPMPRLPVKFRYMSLVKKVRKKTLRNNKKIVFLSGCERWPYEGRASIFTTSQLRKIQEKLPPERRLMDRPVTKRPFEEIESRLHEMPLHFESKQLRKRAKFRFRSIPGLEIVTVNEDYREYMKRKSTEHVKIIDFLKGNEEEREALWAQLQKKYQ